MQDLVNKTTTYKGIDLLVSAEGSEGVLEAGAGGFVPVVSQQTDSSVLYHPL